MKISEIGEFGFLSRLKKNFLYQYPEGVIGVGDDCAIIPQSDSKALLVTTDLLIENIHFYISQISARSLGYKALAVNLSDIAAKGGFPQYVFLSIALPSQTKVEWLDQFYSGFLDLAQKYNTLLLGGDTTQSPDKIFINVTLLGQLDLKNIKLRSSAQIGDIIVVTDFLGDSSCGFHSLQVQNRVKVNEDIEYLRERHFLPKPAIEEGQWLSQQEGVHAMMDISDGISSDLHRIMEQSKCGVRIHLESIPLSKSLMNVTSQYHWQAWNFALSGGEDYSLLLTVDQKEFEEIHQNYLKRFNRKLFVIGEIIDQQEGFQTTLNNQPYAFNFSQFEHFKS